MKYKNGHVKRCVRFDPHAQEEVMVTVGNVAQCTQKIKHPTARVVRVKDTTRAEAPAGGLCAHASWALSSLAQSKQQPTNKRTTEISNVF